MKFNAGLVEGHDSIVIDIIPYDFICYRFNLIWIILNDNIRIQGCSVLIDGICELGVSFKVISTCINSMNYAVFGTYKVR